MFYDRFLGFLFVLAVALCGLGLLQVGADSGQPEKQEAIPAWVEGNPGLLLQIAGGALILIGVGGRLCQRWELSREVSVMAV